MASQEVIPLFGNMIRNSSRKDPIWLRIETNGKGQHMSKVDLKGRDFLKLLDYTPEEILYLVDLAAEYKEMKKRASCMTACMARM